MDRRKSNTPKKENEKKSDKPSEQNDKNRDDEILDEEMEEIFHPASEFSLSDLTKDPVEANPHFDEEDYNMHRRESFQYHQPLRKLYHHKHKKSSHKKHSDRLPSATQSDSAVLEKDEPSEDEPLMIHSENEKSASSESQQGKFNKDDDEKVQFYVGSSLSLENATASSSDPPRDKLPLKSVLRNLLFPVSRVRPNQKSEASAAKPSLEELSSATVSPEVSVDLSPRETLSVDALKPKVKFLLGEESQDNVRHVVSDEDTRPRKRQQRRHSIRRKHHGFNIDSKQFNTVLEPEEAETLQIVDIDDMASHRCDDPKGMRRHKIKDKSVITSFFNLKRDDSLSFSFIKKKFDHEPHELFVELHELKECVVSAGSLEWRQTARWIKYEEDVELGPDKWGKPHVPPLSFHSLLKLRGCLESGGVILDLEETDLVGILRKIVEKMQQTDQIKAEEKDSVMCALLLRHRHVNEKLQHPMRRNSSGYGNLNLLSHDKNSRSPIFINTGKSKSVNSSHTQDGPSETVILMPSNNNSNVAEITSTAKKKQSTPDKQCDPGILRRVPDNSEGAAVLVGQLENLVGPASVFVRLAEGLTLPNFLENLINHLMIL